MGTKVPSGKSYIFAFLQNRLIILAKLIAPAQKIFKHCYLPEICHFCLYHNLIIYHFLHDNTPEDEPDDQGILDIHPPPVQNCRSYGSVLTEVS